MPRTSPSTSYFLVLLDSAPTSCWRTAWPARVPHSRARKRCPRSRADWRFISVRPHGGAGSAVPDARSGRARHVQVAQRRPRSRRAIDRGLGREGPAERRLLRRDRRRSVEDDRRGETWTPVTDGQVKSSSVGAVAVSDSNPDIVFIGMGESCIRGNIEPGDGVYKSTDAGKTWTTPASVTARTSRRSASIRPTRTSSTSRVRPVRRAERRARRSSRAPTAAGRGGACCSATTRPAPSICDRSQQSRTSSMRRSGRRSASSTDVERRPGQRSVQVHRRRRDWTEITRNPGLPPAGLIGRIGVAVSPADSNRVYALVENEDGGLFRSDDAGATWQPT